MFLKIVISKEVIIDKKKKKEMIYWKNMGK